MSLQSIFKRKTSYSTLLDTNEPGHASENNNNDHSRNEEEGNSPQNGDGGVNDGTQKGTAKPESDLLEAPPLPTPEEDQIVKKIKKKSFFRTFKNIILLKKLRSSAAKRQKRKRSVYEELDEDFGELDEADFEVVVMGEEGEEDDGYESIESAVRNGGNHRVDGRTEERIASQRRVKGKEADRDSYKPKRVRFKKKKSTTKKVLKATKTTGKFIGRGIIYTGSSFQYLAPVTSPPPERTWKKWHERPSSRPYRQTEFPFM